jgi:hypothetical protein
MSTPVLAILGDYYHDPKTLRRGLEPLSQGTFALHCIEATGEVPWNRLTDYPVFLLSKAGYDFQKLGAQNWLGEKAALLSDYVRKGGGLVFLHSGLAGYDDNPGLLGLSKATFTHHPPGLVQVEHRVLGGPFASLGRSFVSEDEQYFVRFTEPVADFFLETHTAELGRTYAGWAYSFGKGRIACLSPGHTLSTLLNPEFQSSLAACLTWSARQ